MSRRTQRHSGIKAERYAETRKGRHTDTRTDRQPDTQTDTKKECHTDRQTTDTQYTDNRHTHSTRTTYTQTSLTVEDDTNCSSVTHTVTYITYKLYAEKHVHALNVLFGTECTYSFRTYSLKTAYVLT